MRLNRARFGCHYLMLWFLFGFGFLFIMLVVLPKSYSLITFHYFELSPGKFFFVSSLEALLLAANVLM